MNIIREEIPSYFTTILRKSAKVKILETLVFIVAMIIIVIANGSTQGAFFKVAVILSAVLILGLTPFIYKAIIKPKYILTEKELIIEKSGKRQVFQLAEVVESNDLRFMYLLNGKKTPLMVSDNFIEDLNNQIAITSKSYKLKGKKGVVR